MQTAIDEGAMQNFTHSAMSRLGFIIRHRPKEIMRAAAFITHYSQLLASFSEPISIATQQLRRRTND